ncbi:MAG: hypothetical protein OXT09_04455 [Myxococcales bacterium]|nr:hypothetical protein [Myxococcales bacterium]
MGFAILDVDDVLLCVAEASYSGMAQVQRALQRHLAARDAQRVCEAFGRHLSTLAARLHQAGTPAPAYVQLRARLEHLQEPILRAGYDLKEWSRQAVLACALIDCDIAPGRRVIDDAADAYWRHIEEKAGLHVDVADFVGALSVSA